MCNFRRLNCGKSYRAVGMEGSEADKKEKDIVCNGCISKEVCDSKEIECK